MADAANPEITTTPAAATPAPAPPAPAAAPAAAPIAASPAFELRKFAGEQLGRADLSERYTDDATLARELLSIAQHAPGWKQQAEWAQRYIPHASEIEAYLAEKQQKAAAPQAEEKWWKAPEFDPAWEHQVYQDPTTGEVKARPGASPDLPIKLAQWRQFQANKLNEIMRDPMAVLQPGIEKSIVPVIEKLLEKHLGGYQQQQQAQSFVASNSNWLFQTDPVNKTQLRDPVTGQPALSPTGQRFRQHVLDLEKAGITNIAVQQQLAMQLTEGELLRAAYGQNPQPNAAAPATLAALNIPSGTPAVTTPAAPSKMPLHNRMKEALANLPDEAFSTNGR